jgi:hypothetical protein
MLIAARSSHEFAFCSRAMAMARSKCTSAVAASGACDISSIFSGGSVDLRLAPLFLGCFRRGYRFADQRRASSNCTSSAWARAKCGKKSGIQNVAPVVRPAVIPEINILVASEALPAKANTLAWFIIPRAFQNREPFSSARATCSWA